MKTKHGDNLVIKKEIENKEVSKNHIYKILMLDIKDYLSTIQLYLQINGQKGHG